jgi:hypothetical protein
MYAGSQKLATPFTLPVTMEKLENWYGASNRFQKIDNRRMILLSKFITSQLRKRITCSDDVIQQLFT